MPDIQEVARLKITPGGGDTRLPVRQVRFLRHGEQYRIEISESLGKQRRRARRGLSVTDAERWIERLREATVPAFPESPLVCDGEYLELSVQGEFAKLILGWWTVAPDGAQVMGEFAEWLCHQAFPTDYLEPGEVLEKAERIVARNPRRTWSALLAAEFGLISEPSILAGIEILCCAQDTPLPVSFAPLEISATMEGRMTQFRRPAEGQLQTWHHVSMETDERGREFAEVSSEKDGRWTVVDHVRCPYGQTGSRLFVLEDPGIVLEIEWVYLERLQQISNEDARRTGVVVSDCDEKAAYALAFRSIWQTTHGVVSWDADPWVWVVAFKCISRTSGIIERTLLHNL